jgi:hypothetical protein
MIDRTSIIRLNELHDDDLSAEIQRNPELQHLISYLRTITPPEIDAWKESVRQSRLHDWENADDDEEAATATIVDDEQTDAGNSNLEKHDEQ